MEDHSLPDDCLVCFCHQVTVAEVKAAIAKGAKTVSAIQDETLASTGCGGCRVDVEMILESTLKGKL